MALLIGTVLIYLGDRVLGVKIELFSGMSTFSFVWLLDIVFLPFMVGMVIAWIFGKQTDHSAEGFRFAQGISFIIWLCYLPPLIVRCASYANILYVSGIPEGTHLMPLGLWVWFVVTTMLTAGTGEIVGEVIIKAYSRTSRTVSIRGTPPSSIKEPKI